jgi:hypothetical protein
VDLIAKPSFTDLVEDEDQVEDDEDEEQKSQEVRAGINHRSKEQSSSSIKG